LSVAVVVVWVVEVVAESAVTGSVVVVWVVDVVVEESTAVVLSAGSLIVVVVVVVLVSAGASADAVVVSSVVVVVVLADSVSASVCAQAARAMLSAAVPDKMAIRSIMFFLRWGRKTNETAFRRMQ
jgi:hypothetical protein